MASSSSHMFVATKKQCLKCKEIAADVLKKNCVKCFTTDPFVYFCLDCSYYVERSNCQHPRTSWLKRCLNCSDMSSLDEKLCTNCSTESTFQFLESEELQGATGFSLRPMHDAVTTRGQSPSLQLDEMDRPTTADRDEALFASLQDNQSWAAQTMVGLLDGSIPLDTRERQDVMWQQLNKVKKLLNQARFACRWQVKSSEAAGFDAEIKKLEQDLAGLTDAVRQIQANGNRRFKCGHTHDARDPSGATSWIGNRVCSYCWSLHQRRKQSSDTRLKRTPLTEDNEETAVEYFKIHDRVMRYAKAEHKIRLEITGIERIENPELDRRFLQVRSKMFKKDCPNELLIHGTKSDAAELIIQEGFKVGSGGMFGAGIYFATDSTKSAQYCRDYNRKTLLLCEVLLGKTKVCNSPRNDLNLEKVQAEGYDSVFAKRNTKGNGGVANDEYIVYRPEQVTPRYLVKFSRKEDCTIL